MGEVYYLGTKDEYSVYLDGYRDSIMSDLTHLMIHIYEHRMEDMDNMLDYYAKRQESLVDLSPFKKIQVGSG